MRLDLTREFENLEDEDSYVENGVVITSKLLIIRALNNGVSLRIPPGQGGADEKTRRERGALARRVKKMNGAISITVREGEEIQAASHDALIPSFLHAQLCELIDACDPEPKE